MSPAAEPALPLAGRVAAVTGSSRGIGRAIAENLTEAGARVALIARPSEHLEAATKAIPGSIAVPFDLADPDAVRQGFKTIEDQLGRLDVLVNNAAVAYPNRIEEVTDEEIAIQVATNFTGAVFCTRSAIPMLRASGRGAIVNISSESALEPFPFLLMYGATKSALECFTKALLHELREDHIRVTLLVSGLTDTGGFSARWDPEVRARASAAWEKGGYLARVAGSIPQQPADVAEAVRFILTRPERSMVDVLWSRAST